MLEGVNYNRIFIFVSIEQNRFKPETIILSKTDIKMLFK